MQIPLDIHPKPRYMVRTPRTCGRVPLILPRAGAWPGPWGLQERTKMPSTDAPGESLDAL